MKPQRYLALVECSVASCQHASAGTAYSRMPHDMHPRYPLEGFSPLTLWTKPGVKELALADASGAILGTIFEHGTSSALCALPAWFAQTPIEQRAATLTSRFWGGYVAFWSTQDGVTVLRDPSGTIPCYYVYHDRYALFASDIDMLLESRLFSPEIDWRSMTEQMMAIQYRTTATCLSGVRELAQGAKITCTAAGLRHEECWSPWSFGSRKRFYTDAKRAASDVRQTIDQVVAGWSSRIQHPLLPLSGGLDSSIVAAALHSAGATASALTVSTQAPAGDERIYARAAANASHLALQETFYDVDRVDIMRSTAAHLPRPSTRAFAQELDRLTQKVAAARGCDGVFHGGGGDNVFCSLRSIAPVLDSLAVRGSGSASFRTVLDICRLTGASAAAVTNATVRRLMSRRRKYRWPVDKTFLAAGAVSDATLRFDHPWLILPRGGLPGTAAHIAQLLAIQNYLEAHFRHPELATIAPLLSQPLVELCLQIPSWMWVSGGFDRAVARDAFSDRLPAEIIGRRTKGTPDSVVIQLLEANRPRVRSMLTDGLLAQHGILDCAAIGAALANPTPIAAEICSRILTLCDAEAWARSMLNRQSAP